MCVCLCVCFRASVSHVPVTALFRGVAAVGRWLPSGAGRKRSQFVALFLSRQRRDMTDLNPRSGFRFCVTTAQLSVRRRSSLACPVIDDARTHMHYVIALCVHVFWRVDQRSVVVVFVFSDLLFSDVFIENIMPKYCKCVAFVWFCTHKRVDEAN